MEHLHLHRVQGDHRRHSQGLHGTARASRVRQNCPQRYGDDAIYDAGYNSNGRFYERSNEMLGMTPTAWRAGGANTDIRFAIGECALGAILVAQSERGVCAIALADDPDTLVRDLQDQFPHARLIGGDAGFEELVAKVWLSRSAGVGEWI